jgi:hypothetical protein
LAALPNASYVDLSYNALIGPVPAFTSPYISTLLLQSNSLTVSLPGALDFMSALTALRHVDMSGNPLGSDVGVALAGLVLGQYDTSQASNANGHGGANGTLPYGSLVTMRFANASLTCVLPVTASPGLPVRCFCCHRIQSESHTLYFLGWSLCCAGAFNCSSFPQAV